MKKLFIFIILLSLCLTLHAEEKPIISVLDFKTEVGISKSEMRLFISLLSSALFQTKLYTVIDVSERETLLSKLEFSVSDCSDESCQLEIGRLLAAEAIIIGRIGRLGSRYVLSIKMLETDTGRAINTADGVYNSIDDMVDDVGTIAQNLASVHREEKLAEEKVIPDTVTDVEETKTDEIIEETSSDDEKVIEEIPPEPTEEPKKQRFISFSASIGCGGDIPMGDSSKIFKTAIMPLILLDVELNFTIGNLGLGMMSGVDMKPTNSDVPAPYDMFIIPVGGNIRFETSFMLPFFLLIEGMGGFTFSFVSYGPEIGIENILVIKPFSSLGVGAGFAITPNIRLAISIAYMIIFTDNDPIQGLAPFLRAEFHF